MATQDNTFQGGLHQDADPQFQPANSYRDAQHVVFTAGGHLQQEQAARPLPSRPARPVVGGYVLGDEEILFSSGSGTGEIGVLRGDVYTVALTDLPAFGAYVSVQARLDYQGHRLVYFGDGLQFSWVDLDGSPPVVTAVIPDPALPTLAPAAVENGGELPTGVYQACVCLLTASKNAVSYSAFTGVVPVVDEVFGTTAQQLDGAPPQTPASGSIRFSLSNLPANYAFAQLVVATYTGPSNTLQLFRLPLISLNGRSTLDYTYYSFSQHLEPVELAEVLTTLAEYRSAKHLLQKDGYLLAAGVTAPEPVAVDWQAIANNVRLAATIKTVLVQDNATTDQGYKDPLLSANFRGFQRGEVYSFALVPVIGGRAQEAYHIPGASGINGVDPRYLEPYYSQEEYPLTGGYAADAFGSRRIRHHRMPGLQTHALLDSVTAAGTKIKVLGVRLVEAPDFSRLPAAVLAKFDGYYIAVEPRTPANRSILAQGIAQALVPTGNNHLMVSPFNGKYPAVQNNGVGGVHNTGGVGLNGKGDGRYGAFYSPETTILGNDVSAANFLTPVGLLTGITQLVAERRTDERAVKYAHIFCNYTFLGSLQGEVPPNPLRSTTQRVVPGADENGADLPEEGTTLYTKRQNGYYLLQSQSFYNLFPDFEEDVRYQEVNGTDAIIFRQADGSYKNQDSSKINGVSTGVCSRILYNLVADRKRQYGPLESATYYPAAFVRAGSAAPEVFNGDTFIGKVAFQSNTAERQDDGQTGLQFRTLNYYWCESTVNVGYRHSVSATAGNIGTLPYYPKQLVLWSGNGNGVMEYPNALGHPTGYNRQYSFQNTLTPFFPKDGTIATVTGFDNRVLHSELSVEGEQLDAYRIFRANNYHDLPKDKGPISDLWTWNNSLYVHTTGALYKSFFNEATTTTTSEGEVNLGNGGLFPRPSKRIVDTAGGFLGCQHPKASVSTPLGRFWVDADGQRQYLFDGAARELTKEGMRAFFQRELADGASLNLVGSYDYAQERYTLYGLSRGAVSWSARTGKWVSFHDARATYALSTQHRTLLDQRGLAVQNQGPPLYCNVTTITNAEPEVFKTFSNLEFHVSRLPEAVTQYTEKQAGESLATVLKTEYGQDPGEGQSLFTEANAQFQGVVGRQSGSDARLKGKWLGSTTSWLARAAPVIIRQLSVLFRQSYR
jgi:hypothetical protein